jgi:L-amino acid N-acyltransferase YncA
MGDIMFVEVREEDLTEFQVIYNHYVVNTTITFNTESIALEDMRNLVMFTNKRYQAYGIWHDDVCVGYVMLQPYKTRQAYIYTGEVAIYLRSEFVGLGIGKKALDFIEAIAKNKGFHTIVASICSENSRSKNLFINNGYVQCAHFKQVGYKFDRFLDVEFYQKII